MRNSGFLKHSNLFYTHKSHLGFLLEYTLKEDFSKWNSIDFCRPWMLLASLLFVYFSFYFLKFSMYVSFHTFPNFWLSLELSSFIFISLSLNLITFLFLVIYIYIYIYIYISGDSCLFLLLVPPPVNFSSHPVVRGPKVIHHSSYCVILHCIAQID